jgi:hypothetical protein
MWGGEQSGMVPDVTSLTPPGIVSMANKETEKISRKVVDPSR